MCPALALRLTPASPAPMAAPAEPGWLGRALGQGTAQSSDTVPDLIVSEEWIAEISADREPVADEQTAYGVVADETWET